MVVRITTRFVCVDIGEPRDGPQVYRLRARRRLIDVTIVDQLRTLRSHVCQLRDARAAQLSLQAEIPLLHVRRAQVTLKGECRRGNESRGVGRKRVFEKNGKLRGRNEHLQVEIRRAEIEALAWRKRRLIVVDAVPTADDPLPRSVWYPCEAQTWSKVVFVGVIASPRNAVLPYRHNRLRGWIINGGTIARINCGCVVLVANPQRQRQVRAHAPTVLSVEIVTLRAQMLWVVKTSQCGKAWYVLQHLSQCVPGETQEFQQSATFHIREGILLQAPEVDAELEGVVAASPVRIVSELINIGRGPLRVVYLVAQSGEA